MKKLENKVAIITGASRGVGKAIAKLFAEEGAKVVVDYYVSDYEPEAEENAKQTIKEIIDNGGEAIMYHCDVRDENQVKALIEETIKTYGGIDILINNAGYVYDINIEQRSYKDWKRTIDTNLYGTYLCSKLVAERMRDGGSIVSASSTNAVNVPTPESIDYDASKAGIIAVTRAYAKELAPRGIRVNATVAGWIGTEMNNQLPEEYLKEEQSKIYLGRFATTEEIAKLTLFLSSADASFITGSSIVIDGGHD
jgi:3-oxoacyl-[acyl-carrier protein] reductase